MIDNTVLVEVERDDGKTYTIGGNSGWRIPNDGLVNITNLPHDLSTTEIPNYDGGLLDSKRVGIVDRTIIAVVEKPQDAAELRASAISFFSPKHTYTMTLTYLGRTRKCTGEQAGFNCTNGNVYQQATLTWTILCTDPYWTDGDSVSQEMTRSFGKFGFPWFSLTVTSGDVYEPRLGFPWYSAADGQAVVPAGAVTGTLREKNLQDLKAHGLREGAIFGYNEHLTDVSFKNESDVESGLHIEAYATGEVWYPTFRVGYAYIRMNTVLVKGDLLKIDTSSMPPTIKINGKNAMHKIDPRSNIVGMVADSGYTNFRYDCEKGENNLNVTVGYAKRYLGV